MVCAPPAAPRRAFISSGFGARVAERGAARPPRTRKWGRRSAGQGALLLRLASAKGATLSTICGRICRSCRRPGLWGRRPSCAAGLRRDRDPLVALVDERCGGPFFDCGSCIAVLDIQRPAVNSQGLRDAPPPSLDCRWARRMCCGGDRPERPLRASARPGGGRCDAGDANCADRSGGRWWVHRRSAKWRRDRVAGHERRLGPAVAGRATDGRRLRSDLALPAPGRELERLHRRRVGGGQRRLPGPAPRGHTVLRALRPVRAVSHSALIF